MIDPNEDFNNRIEVARLHHEETLRDQFAMAALPMLFHPRYVLECGDFSYYGATPTYAAEKAYELANAMLEARTPSQERPE